MDLPSVGTLINIAMTTKEPLVITGVVAVILVLGFLVAKFLGWIVKKISRGQRLGRYVEYIVVIVSIFLALMYISPKATNTLVSNLAENLPVVISAILVLILGLLLVNIIMAIIGWILGFIKLRDYLTEVGLGSGFLFAIDIIVRVILYLVVIQITIDMFGVSSSLTSTMLSAIGWAVIFLAAALVFYATKDFFSNWFSSLTLRSSEIFAPGKLVALEDVSGEIVTITPVATILDSGKGHYIWVPNNKLVNSRFLIHKSSFDLKPLEYIRRHYIPQEPSHCAPASAAMALEFFGFKIKDAQKKLAKLAGTKVPGGTNAKKLLEAVKKLTKNDVIGMIVPYKDVVNLKEEIKSWLADGGLVVVNFYKAALFPGVKREQKHAALCVGVEGDRLVIVDPNPKTGGVYMVHYKDMERAMGFMEGDERSYVVYAPRGTRAYWRIKNKLYYANPMYYEKLTKTFERKLKQVLRETRKLGDVLPGFVRELIDEYKAAEKEKVERLWSP